MKKALFLTLFLLPLFASAQQPQYRVLLPVYFEQSIPGAFSSAWKTAYTVHNPSPNSFHIDWCPGSSDPMYDVCTRPLLDTAHLPPGDTETTLPDFSHDFQVLNDRGGPRLLYIRPFDFPVRAESTPALLSFALRAFDVTRSTTNAGTEVPVVREEQFRRSTTSLLNIPTHPSFRLTLRLFETKLKVAGFTIRVFHQETNQLLGERDVQLSWHFPHHYRSMFEPPFLQIGEIRELLPAGTTLPPTLRIEVQPRSVGSEFWAFVSITNNDTQHLTLVTPQ